MALTGVFLYGNVVGKQIKSLIYNVHIISIIVLSGLIGFGYIVMGIYMGV